MRPRGAHIRFCWTLCRGASFAAICAGAEPVEELQLARRKLRNYEEARVLAEDQVRRLRSERDESRQMAEAADLQMQS